MPFLSRWLLAAGFCLLIFGGKLWLLDYAGSDIPSWDQWDGEGEVMLRPWLEGWLRVKEITHPHNEHRIIITKLYNLGLFVANGQWDDFVETVANAIVHTLAALVLLLLGRRWLRGRPLLLYGALLVLLFTLPFSWENSLFGFQSQFYFLLLFSLLHLWLTIEDDHFTGRWGWGQLCGLLGLLSMASGFFSSLAVLAVLGHRWLRERRATPQQIVTALICAALSVTGWLMKNDVPGHLALRARGPGEFVVQFLQLIAWPGSAMFPWSLLLFAPAAVFIFRRVRSRTTTSDEAIQLGLVAWFLLQCLATAYARGGSGAVLSSRYMDLLALNIVLGLVFVVQESRGRFRPALIGLWLVAAVAGLSQQTHMMRRDFVEPNIVRQERQETNVRDYLRTDDPAHLLNKPWGEVPYPVGEVLVERLKSPLIRAVMPPSVRRAVPVANGAPVAVPAGLHPTLEPIALSTWSIPAAPTGFHWRSPMQPASTLPVLRFQLVGDHVDATHGGELIVRSAAGAVSVFPASGPGRDWKRVNIFRPAGEWWIEATAPQAGGWFAFTEPVEVGRWSWFAEKLMKNHLGFLVAGAGLLLAGAIPARRRPRA